MGKLRRLHGYDYSTPGYYFVTTKCWYGRQLFGTVKSAEVYHSDLGKIADECWQDIPFHFPTIALDVSVTMPNHVHGLLRVLETSRIIPFGERVDDEDHLAEQATEKDPLLISHAVGSYKSAVSREIHKIPRYRSLDVWRDGLHDRIVRADRDLWNIREYIRRNPERWEQKKQRKPRN